MLIAAEAEISKLRIIKHEGSITAATVAVANQMTIYFPSDKIHRASSWTTQPINDIENHSQFKYRFVDFLEWLQSCGTGRLFW
jgi:hypothetical protein